MPNPVQFRLATADSAPTGTGSFSFTGKFQIIVENLAFAKLVSIWGRTSGSNTWSDFPAKFVESLPGNLESWETTIQSTQVVEFVARYIVNGTTFWDNNGGGNYHISEVADEFDLILGNGVEVVMGPAGFSDPTHVSMNVAVRNLAFVKSIGTVYTTDGWATTHVANGTFNNTDKSGFEVWDIAITVPSGSHVECAIFYQVLGQEFWDNNFSRNYKLAVGAPFTPLLLAADKFRLTAPKTRAAGH